MPDSMMMDEVTSNLNVMGSNRAIVPTGPIPGKTPTTVPRTVPTKAKKRFIQERETLKPIKILWNIFDFTPSFYASAIVTEYEIKPLSVEGLRRIWQRENVKPTLIE